MKVSDVGEFALIDRIKSFISQPKDGVIVGIGDDAAVVETDGNVILTTDVVVEGVHFNEKFPDKAIGYKALAASISDIAAMGGRPRFALVSLGLPGNTDLSFVDDLYAGMADCALKYGVGIVGGNVSRSPSIFIGITVSGEAAPDGILRRRGAAVGDTVMVTGFLGGSAAGLLAVNNRDVFDEKSATDYGRLHFYPPARVREGGILVKTGCNAAEDISDSFLKDLNHLCEASGVGAEIKLDRVPVAAEAVEVASKLGIDPFALALTGGEDYELLFTVSPQNQERVVEALEKAGAGVSAVGKIVSGKGIVILDRQGKRYRPPGEGYDHFLSPQ